MNTEIHLFELNYKKFGMFHFNQTQCELVNTDRYQSYIKILFVPKGYAVTVDFTQYETSVPTLFFVNSNQYLNIDKATEETASFIYYNRDFYCVQIHDDEVACDGLLFNNIFEIPKVELNKDETHTVAQLFRHIATELVEKEHSAEEMIRTYLKQIIIHATREWKKQHLSDDAHSVPHTELDFFRDFSRLVEIHFREKHSVSDYAALLNLAPKTLSHKFNKMQLGNPNELIKNRIVLEAKRLLLYTPLSIKEIAYKLGYDDPAYFNRMFVQKAEQTPASFRKESKTDSFSL